MEEIWQFLYRGAYGRRVPVAMTAISAVDMATWDIEEKSHRRTRHGNGRDIEETSDE